MRNNQTDDFALQMNSFTSEEIQIMIDNGTFFDISSGENYLSMHTVIDGNVVQCYQIDNVWYCKY